MATANDQTSLECHPLASLNRSEMKRCTDDSRFSLGTRMRRHDYNREELLRLNRILEVAEDELRVREERLAQLDMNMGGKMMIDMMQNMLKKYQAEQMKLKEESMPKVVVINGITYVPLPQVEGAYAVQANIPDNCPDNLDSEEGEIPGGSMSPQALEELQTKVTCFHI